MPYTYGDRSIGRKGTSSGEVIIGIKAQSSRSIPKLRYFGVGFVSAIIASTYSTTLIGSGSEGLPTNTEPLWNLALALSALTLIALAVSRVIGPSASWHGCLFPALVLSLIGLAVSYASTIDTNHELLDYLGSCCSGVGVGLMFGLWADVLSRIPIEDTEIIVPASPVVTFLCSLPVLVAGPEVLLVAGLLLPVACCATLELSYRDIAASANHPAAHHRHEGASTDPVETGCLCCALFLTYTATGWLDSTQLDQWPLVTEFCSALFGVIFAFCLVYYALRVDFKALYGWLAPLLCLAVFAKSLGTPFASTASLIITNVADIALLTVTFLYFCSRPAMAKLPPAALIAIALAASQLGAVAGNALGLYFDAGASSVAALVALIVCCSASLVLRRSSEGNETVCPEPSPGEADDTPLLSFAKTYGLTPREREVAVLLAEGRTQPYIRERLFLSKSTVATHVASIYRKCDVHSKQEFIDLTRSA